MNEIIKDIFHVALLCLAVWTAFFIGTRNETTKQRTIRYDCRLSEFSPDFPDDVRKECRQRALEYYNQQQQTEKE